ncbi:MAG TPA: hypothetical protein DEB17_06340 [Chlorobaculum sp.]|uniref:Uncharacterized protein n=1 Tax=Chlorobaculum tepidum (strain ATCC 49652 / DSM 12025 / NBRC 103806 / TLS) TaxID=194439 RepID=Q8KCW7_CHLTE|nr:hypothetical protein CT1290 [Chlorobaculum tepidum TLS]HBU23601.1 hypothetical protein [Chlorobaculum sp.]
MLERYLPQPLTTLVLCDRQLHPGFGRVVDAVRGMEEDEKNLCNAN